MSSPDSGRSVLIVEDEAMIAMMLEDFLETLGHRPHGVAATLSEAHDLVGAGGFDLAILDCNLGGEQVWPVADILADRQIPFLISSGGSTADVPDQHAYRPMLEKPYTMGAVAEALKRL